MAENYSLKKTIPTLGIDINITVDDMDLLIELDEAVKAIIVKHYNLTE